MSTRPCVQFWRAEHEGDTDDSRERRGGPSPVPSRGSPGHRADVRDLLAGGDRARGANPAHGGEYRGHAGVVEHGLGYVETWDHLQNEEDRRLDAEFFDAGDRVFVCWRQRAHGRDGTSLDLPAVSVYELRDRRVVRSTMHHLDTAAILAFIERQA